MSDVSNEVSSFSTQKSCECYKKLQTHGIPLFISDENDYLGESQKKISFENAFELPGTLKVNEDITEYLIVGDNELSMVFNHMAEVIPNLWDFDQNLLSFWILDMFIEGLWTAQNAYMSFENQKATLYWIAYMFNYIQKENPTRKNLFNHLKRVLFHVDCKKTSQEDPGEGTVEPISKMQEKKEEEGQGSSVNWKDKGIWKLPLPPNIEGMKQKEPSDDIKTSEDEEDGTSTNECSGEDKVEIEQNEEENCSLKNLSDMKVILDILYRIFGRFWVYMEIQTVFHAMPLIQQVDLPFTPKIPKPLMKPEAPAMLKPDKIGRKPSLLDKSSEENEMGSEMQLHKNDFILPLQLADESKIILKQYFPQPSSQRSNMSRRKT